MGSVSLIFILTRRAADSFREEFGETHPDEIVINVREELGDEAREHEIGAFQSFCLRTPADSRPVSTATTPGKKKRGPKQKRNELSVVGDFVINAGGPAWTLDWCPAGEQGEMEETANYDFFFCFLPD